MTQPRLKELGRSIGVAKNWFYEVSRSKQPRQSSCMPEFVLDFIQLTFSLLAHPNLFNPEEEEQKRDSDIDTNNNLVLCCLCLSLCSLDGFICCCCSLGFPDYFDTAYASKDLGANIFGPLSLTNHFFEVCGSHFSISISLLLIYFFSSSLFLERTDGLKRRDLFDLSLTFGKLYLIFFNFLTGLKLVIHAVSFLLHFHSVYFKQMVIGKAPLICLHYLRHI
ncbi:hypothetical protein ACJX0J_025664 [Zea mays]